MQIGNLASCPRCGGIVRLYGCSVPVDGVNCFARCADCRREYPLPKAWLKSRGVTIYPQSIKKAVRVWNETALLLERQLREKGEL